MNYIRAYCQRSEIEGQEAGSPIRFTASTEGIKRDGLDLKSGDWLVDNFKRNPVFLWVHDYTGSTLPIGRVIDVSINDNLAADVIFDQQDEFARRVESKYRRGFLNAVSVGWGDVVKGKRTFHDLMDISAVPVPSDPDALMDQMRAGLRGLQREIASILDVDGRPYIIAKNDKGEFCIHKKDENGQPMGESFGCHPTKEAAEQQLKAILANTHEPRAVWVTVDEMRELCSSCAEEMEKRNFSKINLRQMPPQMLAGLCSSIGGDPGFFTGCMSKSFGEFEAQIQKENFCAWLHHECLGTWPGEHSANVPDVRLSNVDVWEGIATAMVALYQPKSAIEDETRQALYIVLERAYRRLGKTAPEFLSKEEITALSDTELRGLFLEDEFVRAGAVLSARNRGDLEQAITLIQSVLERAAKEEKEPQRNQDENRVRDVAYTLRELFNKEFPK